MKQGTIFFAAVVAGSLCMELSCIMESDAKCHNCKPPREQKPSNAQETSNVVIASFLNMFAQFLKMVSNPHDKDALVTGGMGIATSLAAIATQACKCVEAGEVSPEEMLAYVSVECTKDNIDPVVTQQLTDAIKLRYWQSALLPQEIRVRYATRVEHSDTSIC